MSSSSERIRDKGYNVTYSNEDFFIVEIPNVNDIDLGIKIKSMEKIGKTKIKGTEFIDIGERKMASLFFYEKIDRESSCLCDFPICMIGSLILLFGIIFVMEQIEFF